MSQHLRFQDKVAVVTGAGRGIGEGIARRLADEGAKVAVVSRTQANSARTAEAINAAHPGAAIPYALDVAVRAGVVAAVETILSDFGKVDILVNNAGITRDTLAMRMSEADWDVVIDTNLKGAFQMTQAFLRSFLKQRGGRVINISSIVGLTGNAGQANYAASKAGLIGLTKSLAKECASRGVTVNAIAPGFIATDMTGALSEELKKGIIANIPMGRIGEPGDIAGAVAFFASDDAKFITGQVLTVDGGMVM